LCFRALAIGVYIAGFVGVTNFKEPANSRYLYIATRELRDVEACAKAKYAAIYGDSVQSRRGEGNPKCLRYTIYSKPGIFDASKGRCILLSVSKYVSKSGKSKRLSV